MNRSKNAFVFLFVLFQTNQGKFKAYAKRVTPQKANNMFLKILSKNRKIIKFETVAVESMSRNVFLENRKELFNKAKLLNHDYNNDFIVITMTLPSEQTIQKQGGMSYEHDSRMQRPPLQLQTRMHPKRSSQLVPLL